MTLKRKSIKQTETNIYIYRWIGWQNATGYPKWNALLYKKNKFIQNNIWLTYKYKQMQQLILYMYVKFQT